MSIQRPLNTKEVCEVSRRGVNRVRNAANAGALKSLPRTHGAPHYFTEAAVQEWIDAGSPEMPPARPRLTGKRKAAS